MPSPKETDRMPIAFEAIRQHAFACALSEACTTSTLAARALSASRDDARAALNLATQAGYLRVTLLPGMGNNICYQPTPKAAGASHKHAPKFLRAGLTQEARWRGLMRGYVRFCARPQLSYLPATEQGELCLRYGIPERGHARALVGLDGAHYHLFATILHGEKPIAAIESASFRWLPLLESGTATLHFVAADSEALAAIREALSALQPSTLGSDLQVELAALDAEIAADHSGVATLKLAAPRAALVAKIQSNQTADVEQLPPYPWLGDVVEAKI